MTAKMLGFVALAIAFSACVHAQQSVTPQCPTPAPTAFDDVGNSADSLPDQIASLKTAIYIGQQWVVAPAACPGRPTVTRPGGGRAPLSDSEIAKGFVANYKIELQGDEKAYATQLAQGGGDIDAAQACTDPTIIMNAQDVIAQVSGIDKQYANQIVLTPSIETFSPGTHDVDRPNGTLICFYGAQIGASAPAPFYVMFMGGRFPNFARVYAQAN